MTAIELVTYCRICEPLCGLVATVEDSRLVAVRGDKENPLSQGFQCVKSEAMIDVVYDSDRLLSPQRRRVDGSFEPTTWEQAQSDVAVRLKAIIAEHGPESVALFLGNPPAFSFSSYLAMEGFQKAVGTPYKYGVNGEDGASMLVALSLMLGNPTALLKPDLWHTDFAIIIGSNPYVSHGSTFTEPRIRDSLKGVVERGGRVVVIDPRRTETAKQFEHLGIRAGTDGWLLAAMLREILRLPAKDRAFLDRLTSGIDDLRAAVEPFTPERAAEATGISAATISKLATDFHAAKTAVVYGRTGTCTQQFGTLVNAFQYALCIVTGNIDRPGGLLWPGGPIDFTKFAQRTGIATYGKVRTRTRGLPDVVGLLPSQGFAEDIATDSESRIRAVIMMGANPVLSSGAGGPHLEAALDRLDLFVALDFYVTETTKHAHYVLPTSTWYEREDIPLLWLGFMIRPTLLATGAVVDRIGDTREEWAILDDLARRMGLGGCYSLKIQRQLAKIGVRPSPRFLVDTLIRLSSAGDLFGLRRSGISFKKLITRYPHGKVIAETIPSGVITKKKLKTKDRRIQLAPPEILEELVALADSAPPDGYPLRGHGLREVRSHNSWMHNSQRLMPENRRYAALMNPTDAAGLGVFDGGEIVVTSPTGSIRVAVRLSDDITPGNVALPHGWGHAGGWQRANRAGGVNSNLLVSAESKGIERLAGMSVLNGIPIRVEPAGG